MCDVNGSNDVPTTFTCKPGNGSPANTDAVCTPNSFKSPTSKLLATVGGGQFSTCCNKVVNPATANESRGYLSNKCLNDK